MSFLHSHNIIHCDLKPENIIFDSNLYPKIFRFHLAKQISDDSDQIRSELVGTLVYLAPEILKEKKYSKKSDVYAFSLILYEILTNEKPFHDFSDNMDLIEKVKCQKFRPEINKNISQSYKNLIEKCWSQEPQDRPSFDEILYILKNDSSIITDQVNKEEYFKYIEFIESSNTSFNNTKKIHHFDHIINTQLQFFNQQFLFDFNDKYSTCINPVVFSGYMFDLSDFEKHEMLGEGSFGRVFKIVNKKNGLIYAVKESFKYFNDFSDNLIRGLRREILVLSKLNHPTVLKYIGFNYYNIKNKPKPTFILEYASNGSLYDILEIERKGKKVKEWTNTAV